MVLSLKRKETGLSSKRSCKRRLASFVVASLVIWVTWVGIWNPTWVSRTMCAVSVEKPSPRKDTGMITTTRNTWDWRIILVNIVESPLRATTVFLLTWKTSMGLYQIPTPKDRNKLKKYAKLSIYLILGTWPVLNFCHRFRRSLHVMFVERFTNPREQEILTSTMCIWGRTNYLVRSVESCLADLVLFKFTWQRNTHMRLSMRENTRGCHKTCQLSIHLLIILHLKQKGYLFDFLKELWREVWIVSYSLSDDFPSQTLYFIKTVSAFISFCSCTCLSVKKNVPDYVINMFP